MLLNRLNGLATAVVCVLMLLDAVLFAALWSAWCWRHGGFDAGHDLLWHSPAILLGFFYASRRLYRYRAQMTSLSLTDRLGLSLRISLGLVLGSALIAFVCPPAYLGRPFAWAFAGVCAIANTLLLGGVPGWLARNFFPEHTRFRAALVGAGPLPVSLRDYLMRNLNLGLSIDGFYTDQPSPSAPWPRSGDLQAFFARAKAWEAETIGADGAAHSADPLRPDCVLAFNFDHGEPGFQRLVSLCQRRGIRLQAFAGLPSNVVEPVQFVSEGDLNFFVFMQEPLEDPVNRLFKRCVDYLIAVPVVLLVFPPLAGLIWIMHRWQAPGPLIYRQLRYGLNRKSFHIFKFRTMRVAPASAGFVQATRHDPRIFAFGRFLRRTSLDEIPQFLNVLKGEMSVVGPRPHPVQLDHEMQDLVPTYRARHYVRPGITGYAQVLGFRGETDQPGKMIERVRKDIQYVRNWSLGLDLKIILQTTLQMWHPPRSAY